MECYKAKVFKNRNNDQLMVNISKRKLKLKDNPKFINIRKVDMEW